MASTSPGYGITIRVDGPASAQPVSEITQAILAAGASITALDVVESVLDRVVIDVTCDAIDAEHAEAITASLSENKNLNVRKVSDRTFLLHLGGKIEIASKVPLKTRDDLSRAYTPGVARISQAIAKDPSDLRRLTIKRNTVRPKKINNQTKYCCSCNRWLCCIRSWKYWTRGSTTCNGGKSCII